MFSTRAGTVKSLNPFLVLLDGETKAQSFKKLTSYNAKLDERIIAIKHGNTYIVIGGVE